MTAYEIASLLTPDSLFFDHIQVESSVDSTNTALKGLAKQGAPEGAVLLAEEQTAGRGTQGRSFVSPKGDGLYLSLLLRPRVPLSDLLTLTGHAAVAVRDAIEAVSGASAAIKWLNDIYLNGRKLCGILTELGPFGPDGLPDYVVVGIGVNVAQSRDTFRTQALDAIATSLAAEGFSVSRSELAAAILRHMEEMYRRFPAAREEYLARYQAHCLTVGRTISFQWEGRAVTGTAKAIDPGFSLIAEDWGGVCRTISSGTVTLL